MARDDRWPSTAQQPFDVLHAQYGYPNGLGGAAAPRGQLGVPAVVSIQGGDGHWVGTCCETHRARHARACSTTRTRC